MSPYHVIYETFCPRMFVRLEKLQVTTLVCKKSFYWHGLHLAGFIVLYCQYTVTVRECYALFNLDYTFLLIYLTCSKAFKSYIISRLHLLSYINIFNPFMVLSETRNEIGWVSLKFSQTDQEKRGKTKPCKFNLTWAKISLFSGKKNNHFIIRKGNMCSTNRIFT